MERVLVAMSGGVDSSAALILLKRGGYEPVGVTMELLNGIKGTSPSTDIQFAESVAHKLGADFHGVDYSRMFEARVIKPFIESYRKGETPNPCVECNRYLKFGALFELADSLGIRLLATGHYARIEEIDGVFRLKKAVDIKKDQSYVLCNLTQAQLSRLIFPLGGLCKSEIREIARESGLPNASKSESQDICFVRDGDYAGFIERYGGTSPARGDFLDKDGNRIGTHAGSIHFTIGQRRGLGTGFGERLYVVSKDPDANTVTLGKDCDLYADTLFIDSCSFISGVFPKEPFEASVRIRYLHKEQPAVIYPIDECRLKVVFREPQRAIAAGQWGVIYDGEYVLGGGVIHIA